MHKEAHYCRLCGRQLKNKHSIEQGFGDVCLKRYLEQRMLGGLLDLARHKKGNESE